MKLGSIHHVSLDVRELEMTGEFYRDTLGLPEIPRPELGFPGLWFQAGAQQIHLQCLADREAPPSQHFAFHVEDLDAALAELDARGVQVSPARDIPGGGRQAFLRDPSGNLIELNQPAT